MKKQETTFRISACLASLAALTASAAAQQSATESKLTLDQCISLAVSSADRHQRQQLRLDEGKKRLDLSKLAFSPSYSALGQARLSFGDNLYDLTGGTTGERYEIGIRSEYAVYDSGNRNYKLQMAKLDLEDARLTNLESNESLIIDTVAAYCELASNERKCSVRNLYLEAAEAHLTDAEQRFNLGLVAKPEVDVALSNVESARSDLAFFDSHRKISAMRLSVLIGHRGGETLPVVPVDAPEESSQMLPPSLADDVVRHNPSLAKAQNALQSAKEQLKVVQSGYGPVITTYAAAGYLDRADPIGSTHFTERPFLTLGIGIKLPLLDRRSKQLDEQIQKDEIQMRFLAAKDVENHIREDSLETLTGFPAIVAQIKSLKAAETAGMDSFRLAEARYKNGVGTQTEVLIAMRDLSNTRNELADAQDVRDRILKTTQIQSGSSRLTEIQPLGRQQ